MSGNPPVELTKKDFMSDQMVRWCPGCGDYAILSQVQTVFAGLSIPKEKFAVIAGIGCSSRFPYYVDTYGFHTIHGRAPAFATGLKATRPDLSVWVVTGDGDSLSIGGNHIIHLFRRNVDLNVMLFNNRIYGLTKGQYSPTSELGKKTKSTPMGSIDAPFNPITLALGAGAPFVARSVDVFSQHLRDTLEAANAHRGTSLVEIYQNCNIFNDGAFREFTERDVRDEKILHLESGKPLLFGTAVRRGLVLDGLALRVVEVGDGEGQTPESRVLVHDASNVVLANLLAAMDPAAGFPIPIGIFYDHARPTYDDLFQAQASDARRKLGDGDLARVLQSGETWTIGS